MKLLLVPFTIMVKRYHTNENISEIKLFLVIFYYSKRDHMNLGWFFFACYFLVLIAKNWKKCLMLYTSISLILCISIFDVAYKINRPSILHNNLNRKSLISMMSFLTIKWAQKRVHRNGRKCLPWDSYELC